MNVAVNFVPFEREIGLEFESSLSFKITFFNVGKIFIFFGKNLWLNGDCQRKLAKFGTTDSKGVLSDRFLQRWLKKFCGCAVAQYRKKLYSSTFHPFIFAPSFSFVEGFTASI